MPMGNGCLVMTILKVWAHFIQLNVGGKVELEMDSYGELHIRPKEASGSEKHSDDGEES